MVKGAAALMSEWPRKALPLTACCLSPPLGFGSRSYYMGKLPVTWSKAMVLAGCCGFFHHIQLASYELA